MVIRNVANDEPARTFSRIFAHNQSQKGDLAKTTLDLLENLEVNFQDCRGQSYDNASNMAGKYSGMQAHLKKINPQANFIPCAAHSLNLVGAHAVDSCGQAVSFFGLVQRIYVFFAASTRR